MKANLGLATVEVKVKASPLWARLAAAFGRPPRSAGSIGRELLDSHWSGALRQWPAPPEALSRNGARMDLVLREALLGAALAILGGAENPIAKPGSYGPFAWDDLARKISSARAKDPAHPFHGANALLRGPMRVGSVHGPIGLSGAWDFYFRDVIMWIGIEPLAEAAELLAMDIERAMIARSCGAAPGSGAPRRL